MAENEVREKAVARPIDGPYAELAREVRKLLGYYPEDSRPFLTSRMAARKTGVNHATITTIVRGDRPSEGTLLKLAVGLGADPSLLLTLAGYPSSRYIKEQNAMMAIGPSVDRLLTDRPYTDFFTGDGSFNGRTTFGTDPHADDKDAPLRAFSEVRRFDLEDIISERHAFGVVSIALQTWGNHNLASSEPILPYTDRQYQRNLIADYMEARAAGDPAIAQIDGRYRLLLEKCFEWSRRFLTDAPESGSPANTTRLFIEIGLIHRQNTLACVAWYEGRRRKRSEQIGAEELLGWLDAKPKDLMPPAGGMRSFLDPGLRAVQEWRRALEQCHRVWSDADRATQAQRLLGNALRRRDDDARLLGLMYQGFYEAVSIEASASSAGGWGALNWLTLSPVTSAFAVSVTYALLEWFAAKKGLDVDGLVRDPTPSLETDEQEPTG